jgi:hypothetical protein
MGFCRLGAMRGVGRTRSQFERQPAGDGGEQALLGTRFARALNAHAVWWLSGAG